MGYILPSGLRGSELQGCGAEFLLECADKVAGVLKAALKGNFIDILICGAQQMGCKVKSFVRQPFTGRGLVQPGKGPFERAQAHVAEVGELFQFQVIGKICFHHLFQVCGLALVQ